MKNYHLGLNLGHNRSAAIVKDGKILVAINQERLDRCKHSVGFLHHSVGDPKQVQLPHEAINYCLDHLGINMQDIATITGNMPGKDYSADIIKRNFSSDIAKKVVEIPSHHLAHAYTAYWPSKFDKAAILVADASGTTDDEFQTESYSLYKGVKNDISVIHSEKVKSHLASLSTLGFVYEYITKEAGFVTNVSDRIAVPEAGKLMGLAPYGGAQKNWNRWINIKKDSYSLDIAAYDIFLEVESIKKKYDFINGKSHMMPHIVDLAFKIQKELEQALIHLSSMALKEIGTKNLCLAGGVALNSVANYKILKALSLDDIFIFPAAGDDGIAAGCALWAYQNHEKYAKRSLLKSASLGASYDASEVQTAIDKFENKLEGSMMSDQEMARRCAEALSKGNIVARYQGGCEYGPRALGNRSIMADPTFEKMRDIINSRVKFREGFRPFAPVIPEENVSEVFDQKVSAPFMLLVSDIKEEYQSQIPSVTHVDGTGRVQTVTKDSNSFFYDVCHQIRSFRGGAPIILNTSYNVAGQPIVETASEAIKTFLETDIDYLAIENFWISKKEVPVLDYKDHASRTTPPVLPKGLESNSEDVNDYMTKLNGGLFDEQYENCPWSKEELIKLASKAGALKESSNIFKEPVFKGFHGGLFPGHLILLNPMGKSQVIRLKDHELIASYTYTEIKSLIQSYIHKDDLDEMNQQLLVEDIIWAENEFHKMGIQLNYSQEVTIDDIARDSEISELSIKTFQPFSDDTFSMKRSLTKLYRMMKKYGYNESKICQRLDIESLQSIKPTHLHYFENFKLDDSPLDQLIKFFLLRGALSVNEICKLFGKELFQKMKLIGMVIPREGMWTSRVDLFCADRLIVATDHRFLILTEDVMNEDPVMYIGMDSKGLVHTAPRKKTDRVLDLCSGSGIQALNAAAYAKEVTGVDINPRALRFARFNAQLNSVENVKFKLGSLYTAAGTEKYNVVLANPPFVPSPEANLKFRDGGNTGENILREIIQKAPEHLTSNGSLYIVTDLVDINNYEQKVKHWLGSPADTLVLKTADRNDILFSVPHTHVPFGQSYKEYTRDLDKWVRNFHDSGLKNVNFGYILIENINLSEDGSFYVKTIHNPNNDIYTSVNRYFESINDLKEYEDHNVYLDLHDNIKVRTEGHLGEEKKRYQLFANDDSFFTTYEVDQSVFESLCFIKENNPAMSDLDATSGPWVTDLIYKGVVIIRDRINGKRSFSERKTFGKKFIDHKPEIKVSKIQEMETKTTPTCLSSYLRQ